MTVIAELDALYPTVEEVLGRAHQEMTDEQDANNGEVAENIMGAVERLTADLWERFTLPAWDYDESQDENAYEASA